MVDDPVHYQWSSYRRNALGHANAYLTPHPLYLALGSDNEARQAAYRSLFRTELNDEAVSDIRLALNQSQPLGNSQFYAKIEKITGQCRAPRPRGRPPEKKCESEQEGVGQEELPL